MNREAIEKLIRAERPRMVSYALKKRIPLKDAEDVAQDAILKFFRLYSADRGMKAKTYLYMVMMHQVTEYFRNNGPRTRCGLSRAKVHSFSDLDPAVINRLTVEADIVGSVVSDDIEATLVNQLTARERRVMSHRVEGNLTLKEIGGRLKISESRVYQHLESIQAKLQTILGGA